jgi:outer membrane protein OmpA-like peptidoglycan-associated protein
MVEVFADGSMNTPKNLGPKINTIGREMFPYFNNNTLYFSSEGHFGYGGLDIFESFYNGTEFSNPKNIGEPINSTKDDFSFSIDSKLKYGYFSSNREEGKGDDDIYFFSTKTPECSQIINGIVVNSKSKNPIDKVAIKVFNPAGDLNKEYFSDANGKFQFSTNCEQNLRLMASKPNYSTQEKEIKNSHKNGDTTTVMFELANLGDFVIKDNENEKIDINTIFFEYNKWDITPQAAIELDKVVFILQNFPKVRIRIESHTDSKGNDLYNLTLSDHRAKATQKYILSKGINPDKIESAVGFGEMRLKNKCKNDIICSEEEHSINRRSDFIIVEK